MNNLQGTEEWFQARLGKVTASRISDVLAAKTTAAYQNYQAELVAERLTGQRYEAHVTPAMQWGIENEEGARLLYSFMTDNSVQTVGLVDHPGISMSGASPDGLIGLNGQLEIKCPNTANHIKICVSRSIPKKYRDQMTWQMACTGREWCDFVSYDPRLPADCSLCVIRFERDIEAIPKMEHEVMAFLESVDDLTLKLKGES